MNLTLTDLLESPPEQIIFDYDGTLATLPIDWPGARQKYVAYLSGLGMDTDALPQERIDRMEEEVIRVQGLSFERAIAFRQELEQSVAGEHREHRSLCDAARALFAKGCTLAILSNNLQQTVRSGLTQLGLEACFSVVLGVDDVGEPKPSPKGLACLQERSGTDWNSSLLIGDSPSTDGAFCKAVGIPFLQVQPDRESST